MDADIGYIKFQKYQINWDCWQVWYYSILNLKPLLESSIFLAKLRTLYGTLFGALFFLLLATSEAEKVINQDFKTQHKEKMIITLNLIMYKKNGKKIKLKFLKKTFLKIYDAEGMYSITDMNRVIMALNFLSLSNLWLTWLRWAKSFGEVK